MRLELDRFGQWKTYIHIGAGLLLALAWLLSLVSATQKGIFDGRPAWFFILCFLTIPILIYQTMVPAWSRARRFANVYAFATLDVTSVVLWFSAWVALASYVTSGKGKGTNKTGTGCQNFSHGTATKCNLAEVNTLFGVVLMLTFCATSYFSLRAVMEFKRTGIMPGPAGGFTKAQGSHWPGAVEATVSSGGLGGMKSTGQLAQLARDDTTFDPRMNLRSDLEDDEHDDFHDHDVEQHEFEVGGKSDPRQGPYGEYARVGHHEEESNTFRSYRV